MSVEERKPIIGISCGDLNGIGMEVIMKTFAEQQMMDFCTPVVFASSKVASYHRKALGMENFNFQVIHEIDKIVPQKPNLLNCWKEDVNIDLGKEDAKVGAYAVRSIDKACGYLETGKIDALVTAPINKASIQGEAFRFSGHTDYLENRFKSKATMMLVSEGMRMALNSVHIPVSQASAAVTQERVLEKLTSINQSLKNDFHLTKGKIAVLGLNPHAGDQGVIGDEEKNIIAPAIEKAMDKGILAFGPYSADSFFGSGAYKKFDAILAMYHDQGLIPFKSISFGEGVNYSAGLPIIRTSPDHGTAFDIAGKGEANPSSFREAVLLACDLVKRRGITKEIEKSPLPTNNRNADN